MSFDSNLSGLLQFIDWMAGKGYAPANTASSRKAAANKVISALGEDEAADVLAIDVEDAISRFATKHGGNYSTESLQSYKSRLKTTLDDFRDYKSDPVGFRPVGRASSRTKADRVEPKKRPPIRHRTPPPSNSASTASAPPSVSQNVVPVPIREDVVVKVGNLPFDLTAEEAKKIANVILAYGGAL